TQEANLSSNTIAWSGSSSKDSLSVEHSLNFFWRLILFLLLQFRFLIEPNRLQEWATRAVSRSQPRNGCAPPPSDLVLRHLDGRVHLRWPCPIVQQRLVRVANTTNHTIAWPSSPPPITSPSRPPSEASRLTHMRSSWSSPPPSLPAPRSSTTSLSSTRSR
ncbi:hypothetical protein PENTCL1PPCAC_25152, partial [Pristionchus entomophagus]